jgi:hypothetical protein
MRLALRVLLLAGAVGAATWALGWWGVLLVAVVWGLAGEPPRTVALAAFVAWGALLALQAARGPLQPLAERLSGLVGAPAWVALAATPLFAALLAWSAASVLGAIRASRPARQ